MSNEDRPDDTPERDGTTPDTDSESSSRISRRRLLRTGVNTGVAATAVWGLGGADYVSSSDLGSITYALARPDPDADPTDLKPRTKDVPVAWHESLRLAFEAQDAIQETGLSPLVSSFVVPGNYDQPEASLSVQATENGIGDRIEEVTSSVPVDISVVEDVPPRPEEDPDHDSAYQVDELDPEAVPGGVLCNSEDGSGTLTPALFDAETGDPYFATSNHVYGEEGTKSDEHQSEPLWIVHDDDTYRIGEVAEGYPQADIVQIEPIDDYQPATTIERADPGRVIGQYTQLGLADLMARDGSLEKQGAISDHTAGELQGINAMTCYSGEICKPGQLIWGDEDTLTDGDSGSANYRPDPENPEEYVLVGGINNARTWWPGSEFTWGTAAHQLLEEYGLHF